MRTQAIQDADGSPGASGRESYALTTSSYPGPRTLRVEISGLKLPSLGNAREPWFMRKDRAARHRALADLGLRKALVERLEGAPSRHVTRITVPDRFGQKTYERLAESLGRRLDELGATVPPLPLCVTITRNAPRGLDSDNLAGAAKHIRDGIAAWLEVDDRSDLIQWRYGQRSTERGVCSVTISIGPLTTTYRGCAAVVLRRRQ